MLGLIAGVVMGVTGNQYIDRILTIQANNSDQDERDVMILAAKQLSVTHQNQNIGSVTAAERTNNGQIRLSIQVDHSKLDPSVNLMGKSAMIQMGQTPSLAIMDQEVDPGNKISQENQMYELQISEVDLFPIIATAAGGQFIENDLNAFERFSLRTVNQSRSLMRSLREDVKQGIVAFDRMMSPSQWDNNY